MNPAIRLQNVARTTPRALRSARTHPTKRPPPPPPPPHQQANPTRGPPIPLILILLLAGPLGYYTSTLARAALTPNQDPTIARLENQRDVSARYDETADSFDSEVGVSEWLMGITALRRELAGKCKGHVLEASCGTGRNLGYFDLGRAEVQEGGRKVWVRGQVASLAFVDLSPAMVEVCRRKWAVLHGGTVESAPSLAAKAAATSSLPVTFHAASALPPTPLPPSPAENGRYTTILQTMGLCSTPAPLPLLLNLIAHLDTADPDARLILLEHGRSYRGWLNNVLDNSAEKHAEIHGCWFNRDIGEVVEEAARRSGMVISRERRRHLGTTWVFELAPGRELVEASRKGEKVGWVPDGEEGAGSGEVKGWMGWVSGLWGR